MGRNSTFKKRRHIYKVALAVEIRMRAIATNFVVYIISYRAPITCFMYFGIRIRQKYLVLEYRY